jgi:formylmethanofuran dehydrogenase subunit D
LITSVAVRVTKEGQTISAYLVECKVTNVNPIAYESIRQRRGTSIDTVIDIESGDVVHIDVIVGEHEIDSTTVSTTTAKYGEVVQGAVLSTEGVGGIAYTKCSDGSVLIR